MFTKHFHQIILSFALIIGLSLTTGCGGSSSNGDDVNTISLERAIELARNFETDFNNNLNARVFTNDEIVSFTGVGVNEMGMVTNAEPADNPGWYFTMAEDGQPGTLLGINVYFDANGEVIVDGGLVSNDAFVESPTLPDYTSADIATWISTADSYIDSNNEARPGVHDRIVFLGEDGQDESLEAVVSYIAESDFGFDLATFNFGELLTITDVGVLLNPETGVAEGGLTANGFF